MIIDPQLALVTAIIALAIISPGPDFAVTVRNSLAQGRSAGLATAAGIAAGVSVHIGYTVMGLGYLMSQAIWMLELIRYLGAGYLIWLGITALLSQRPAHGGATSTDESVSIAHWTMAKQGFLCNALNPKTALFFVALFTQVADAEAGPNQQLLLGLVIALGHLLWFSAVAMLLTTAGAQKRLSRIETGLNRIIGVAMIGLGTRLALAD
ncbi:LysE family transporter [Ferrimonas kyonanensis]|uniref:LysE family transporter n=1 Tax=Ferrimonas kyonanensis TaxID=364763 RepID=UPI000418EC43|nr:LysE family transporter [Ferrimonas kyonanensis]